LSICREGGNCALVAAASGETESQATATSPPSKPATIDRGKDSRVSLEADARDGKLLYGIMGGFSRKVYVSEVVAPEDEE